MNTARTFVWRKAGVVAAVAMTVLIGNLRTGNSQAAPKVVAAAVGMPAAQSVDTHPAQPDAALSLQQIGTDADSSAEHTESPDDARLVPAIFARDPDVRFVYYRQISKWM